MCAVLNQTPVHTAITARAAWAIRSATDNKEPPAALTMREGHTVIARAA
jgi:hypothetical protein